MRALRLGLLLLLTYFGIGSASAHDGFVDHPSQAVAYQHCMAYASSHAVGSSAWECAKEVSYPRSYTYRWDTSPAAGMQWGEIAYFLWAAGTGCPSGDVDVTTGECSLSCPGGYGTDPYHPTQCMDRDKCLEWNTSKGFAAAGTTTRLVSTGDSSSCVASCEFKPLSASTTQRMSASGGLQEAVSGEWQTTGNACASGTPQSKLTSMDAAQNPKPQECIPVSGQTVCQKKNGDLCASASTGKQFCWKPGETGTKTDGPDLQKRDAGNAAIPPNLNLTNGDTLTKIGNSATTTITTTINNTVVSTTTATTSNYKTTNGTNASSGSDGGQGEPSTGSGAPKGDGKGNSASGGGDCKTPPVVTGDAALAMVATQAWSTRCAVEAGNAATVSGDIGDCNAAWSVEGSNANAIKLRAMRAQICNREKSLKLVEGTSGSDDGALASLWSNNSPLPTLNPNLINLGGSGGNLLPDIELEGQAWVQPPEFYDAIAQIRFLIVAAATVLAMFIVGRNI